MSTDSIRTEHLSRRFGEFIAVRDVSFRVPRGEIFGYLGANGAGKSTTIRMLCGLLRPSSGCAYVAGTDVARDPEAVKRAIGYMSQKFSLYMDLRVEENLHFFGGIYRIRRRVLTRRIDALLERVGLAEQRAMRTGDLPSGLRQRVALVAAMLHEPSILFLDEPTAGVAPAARRMFWRLIRDLASEGTTIFVTTHYMDEAEYCHRIGLMVDGVLVALDSPAVLKREHLPGWLFKLDGPAGLLSAHRRELAALPGVLEAQMFGSALHLRLDSDQLAPERLRQQLVARGLLAVTIEPIEPTLEDVFLALTARDR